jgi:hypothetical protein
MTRLALIGIDVGFSVRKSTSGVAAIYNGELRVARTNATVAARQDVWGFVEAPEVIAIDAPVLPGETRDIRTCERALAGGLFQHRCKPGFSHVSGTGLALRVAGAQAIAQLSPLVGSDNCGALPRIDGLGNIVEAFPNAFLGVCLPDSVYQAMPRLRRGRKFDWLYDAWRAEGLFDSLTRSLDDHQDVASIAATSSRSSDHEQRAALICLLTAACVALGRYTAVGDRTGGFFFLPPLNLWADWAPKAFFKQTGRLEPAPQLWSDGKLCSSEND